MKYLVSHRPIALDLLTPVAFSEPPHQSSIAVFRSLLPSSDENYTGSSMYPFTIHCNSNLGGLITLYTESSASRDTWKLKLNEAINSRKISQENSKAFEVKILSNETFLAPTIVPGPSMLVNGGEGMLTGKVTCSIFIRQYPAFFVDIRCPF
jgi:hypothetical protein